MVKNEGNKMLHCLVGSVTIPEQLVSYFHFVIPISFFIIWKRHV